MAYSFFSKPRQSQNISVRRRASTQTAGLPPAITTAVNRRAFALAQQMYPKIQNDLQALAWELIEQAQSAEQVVQAIAHAEPARPARPE